MAIEKSNGKYGDITVSEIVLDENGEEHVILKCKNGVVLPIKISANDYDIPHDTHISIHKILSDDWLKSRSAIFWLPAAQRQAIRNHALKRIMSLFEKENTNDFPKYWNRNVKIFTENGLNEFANTRPPRKLNPRTVFKIYYTAN
jgi:hypothetical protein